MYTVLTDGKLTVSSDNIAKEATYEFELVVSSLAYPSDTRTKSYAIKVVLIDNPCVPGFSPDFTGTN